MSGSAAENARIFVLHFALNDPVAEGAIIGGRQDGILQSSGGIERRVRHSERTEDFALAEHVDGFVGEAFQGNAENNETDVTVFRARAGSRGQGNGEGGLQKVFTSLSPQE